MISGQQRNWGCKSVSRVAREQSQVFALTQARRAGSTLLLVAFVFSIFVNLLMLTGPLYMLQVYDRVLGSRSEETLVALTLLVAFLYGLMALLEYARGRVVARYAARFQSQLDPLVFDASINAPAKPGAPPSTGLRDLEAIQTTVGSQVFLAFMDIPWSPIFIFGIFIFHPWLGWLAVTGGVSLLILTLLNQLLTYHKVQRPLSTTLRTEAPKITSGHTCLPGWIGICTIHFPTSAFTGFPTTVTGTSEVWSVSAGSWRT